MKFLAFDIVWMILLIYSFIPFEYSKIFWYRFYGIPVRYIPFLFFFFFLFFKELAISFRRKDIIIRQPIVIYCIFIFAYLPIQLITLLACNTLLHVNSYLLDYGMYVFNGLVVFYSTVCYFYNKRRALPVYLKRNIDRMLTIFFTIGLISPVRYFMTDRGYSFYFYNLFNPLRYRLFEVMFLIICSVLALGRYYGTGNKKYLFFFVVYGANILLAGSRTGYVVWSLVLSYIFIREKLSFFLKPDRVFVLVLIVLIFFCVEKREEIGNRILRLKELPMYISLNLDKSIEIDKDVRRISMLLASFEIVKENPFMGIGLGVENFAEHYPYFYLQYTHTVARPHNFYIYLLASTGIIGFVIFFSFLYSMFKDGYYAIKVSPKGSSNYELIIHFLLVKLAIIIIQLGYELETEPFLWFFWGMSYAAFLIPFAYKRDML